MKGTWINDPHFYIPTAHIQLFLRKSPLRQQLTVYMTRNFPVCLFSTLPHTRSQTNSCHLSNIEPITAPQTIECFVFQNS